MSAVHAGGSKGNQTACPIFIWAEWDDETGLLEIRSWIF